MCVYHTVYLLTYLRTYLLTCVRWAGPIRTLCFAPRRTFMQMVAHVPAGAHLGTRKYIVSRQVSKVGSPLTLVASG